MKNEDVKRNEEIITKSGVRNSEGKIIVPIEYDFVTKVNDNLFVATKGSINGLRYPRAMRSTCMPENGEDYGVIFNRMVESKTLDTEVEFYTRQGKIYLGSKILAAVVCKNDDMLLFLKEDYKWSMALIDYQAQRISSGAYVNANSIKMDYAKNRFIVELENRYVIVALNENNRIDEITHLYWEPVKLYDKGAVVKSGDKYGFVDYSGTVILSCIYDEVTPRKAAIQTVTNGGVELFTYDGKLIIGGENYDWCQRYTFKDSDLFMLGHKDGTYCLCSSNKLLLPCEYNSIEICSEFAIVCKEKEYGLLRYVLT